MAIAQETTVPTHVHENVLDEVGRELAGLSNLVVRQYSCGEMAIVFDGEVPLRVASTHDRDTLKHGADLDPSDMDRVKTAWESGEPISAEESPVADNLGELLKRYTTLANERRERSDRMDEIDRDLKPLEEALLEGFAEAGVQNARANGLTVFIRTDRFVSKKGDVPSEAICAKLKEIGCGYMVKEGYNASSLKAKVAEWKADGVTIPDDLASMLNVGEVQRIASRK